MGKWGLWKNKMDIEKTFKTMAILYFLGLVSIVIFVGWVIIKLLQHFGVI